MLNFESMKTLIVLSSVLVCGFSCSPGSATDKDTVSPQIVLNTPISGQNFTPGQAIRISGTITDDKFIAEAHIHVINTNTSTTLMDVHIYPNGTSAVFDQSVTAAMGVNYKIQVIAKDRGVNEASGSVEVSCN